MKMHHIIPAALRPSFIVAVLGAIVATFVVTGTLTAENLGDDYGTLATESFIPDADVDVLSKGVKLNTKTVSPVSDPPPPPPGRGGYRWQAQN